MSRRGDKSRSVRQRVGNRGKERGLSRNDMFTAYVMDRLLHRLGRSRHSADFYLKGGLLVANLVGQPHRFTRDIDVLRRHGSPSPDDLRGIFRDIVSVPADDGVLFAAQGVRAVAAEHDEDGYDGVKVFVRATVAGHEVDVRVDVGFGDAVVPPAGRRSLTPFLAGDEPARVFAYAAEPVIAEKVETLIAKFPVVLHRLKDILDVVTLAETEGFDGTLLTGSLRATFDRRGTRIDVEVIDDMHEIVTQRAWTTGWATMLREKAVAQPTGLREAIEQFDAFVRPLLQSLASGSAPPARWSPGGPWEYAVVSP